MTHRDPLKVLASTANMFATLRWQRSDHVDYGEIVMPISFGMPFVLDMVIDQRRTGAVPDDRFIDVRYRRPDDRPCRSHAVNLRTTRHGTGRLDRRSSSAYLKAKPRGRHGAHAYQVEDLGLDDAEMRAKFANYMDPSTIPEER